MQRSRKFRISPANIADLYAAVYANGGASRGVVLHTVNPNHNGDYLVVVIGLSDEKYYDAVCEMAYLAEKGQAVILPARNKRSDHIGSKGDAWEFDGELYHIGAWTNPSYGLQFIHRFQDGEQNELFWTTGKITALGRYHITCKIKDHKNYGNIYQTAVTYCKFTEE